MFGEDAIAQQLAEARATLRKTVESPEDNQIGDTTVEAAEGMISLTVGNDGRVKELLLDPHVMRSGSEYLAEEIKTAVNSALDERAAAMGTDEPMPDMEAVNQTLEDLQDRGMRQFGQMTASISEVMRKLQGSQ